METAAVRPQTSALAPSAGNRIPELDGLRGIAIGLVVLFHGFYFGPGADYQAKDLIHHLYLWFEGFIAVGWAGVDLFFVLSGFLIGGILLDAKESPRYYKTFYARRFFRIIPPYYAWIFAYVVVMALAGSFLQTHLPNRNVADARPALWAQVLFLQNFGILNSYPAIAGTWFWPTWSLAVEEQFYLIAPAFVRRLSGKTLGISIGVVIVLAPLLRLFIAHQWPAQRIGLGMVLTLMPCRADALGIGILAALLWRTPEFRLHLAERGRFLYALAIVFLGGFVILVRWWPSNQSLPMQTFGLTWIAVFFALVVLLALARPVGLVARIARNAWLRELGRVSYCLYLIHYGLMLICQILLAGAVQRVHSWEGISTTAVAIVISYAIARVSWVYFEHPLVNRGHAFSY
jgi:peptidoglycan/LPS O-acetylase OafA/YrhL